MMPDSRTEPVTIAIIGSGFSGTMLAVHLLKAKLDYTLQVILIEKSQHFARGAAYGTLCPLHLLNVPALQMSAFPDDPHHFLKWAKERDTSVTPATFAQRLLYGKYLQDILEQAEAEKPALTQIRKINDEVVDLTIAGNPPFAVLHLGSGVSLVASKVVLALGNFVPDNPRISNEAFFASSNYFPDPYLCQQASLPGKPVLLIGTGLTMVDKAIELVANGHTGTIHALSRHGLLPEDHRVGLAKLPPPFAPDTLPQKITTLFHLMRQKAELSNDSPVEKEAVNWQQVIDSFRPLTQSCWQSLDYRERSRFLRHVRFLWDVLRHRMAPNVKAMIDSMLTTGQLKIHAGRILDMREIDNVIKVTVLRRPGAKDDNSGAKQYCLRVASVINCTGPASDYGRLDSPLVQSLIKQGLLKPDALSLGIDATVHGALLDKPGKPSDILFTLGPPLKGILWESTAVPELGQQAKQLANELT